MKLLNEAKNYSVLKRASNSRLIEIQRILCKQFMGVGQIVQYVYNRQDRTIKAGLCLIMKDVWVLVYYEDSE